MCFWLAQMIRTTPWRRTTLHLTQIFLTDDLTFTSLLGSAQAEPLIYTSLSVTIAADDPAAVRS